ncbi:MAG: hypothetical protein HY704_06505 [Gemmatimonadetes bacterium]|nr:hypothetical protein [Gemmatimonadota bacterium]
MSGERRCPACGAGVAAGAGVCGECGAQTRATAGDLRAFAEAERSRERRRKLVADLYFLVGLLGGGPLLTLGRMQLGLFLVLGGGLASAARRYTALSAAASALVGFLSSAVIAAAVLEPRGPTPGAEAAAEPERRAYADELAARYDARGVTVEPRGPGLITVWFTVPTVDSVTCGGLPLPPERDRLAALGFVRVIVAARAETGGLCTFRP